MPDFFTLSDDGDSVPVVTVEEILTPPVIRRCEVCGDESWSYTSDIHVLLAQDSGDHWPDILGWCPDKAVSAPVLKAWRNEGIGEFPVQRLIVERPYSRALQNAPPPEYFRLDGSRMFGAALVFASSGFVHVRFCRACRRRTDNIGATGHQREAGRYPLVLIPQTWKGAHLFTTDVSEALFFCTYKVVECAARNRHTHFRFVPIEATNRSAYPGYQYLKLPP